MESGSGQQQLQLQQQQQKVVMLPVAGVGRSVLAVSIVLVLCATLELAVNILATVCQSLTATGPGYIFAICVRHFFQYPAHFVFIQKLILQINYTGNVLINVFFDVLNTYSLVLCL